MSFAETVLRIQKRRRVAELHRRRHRIRNRMVQPIGQPMLVPVIRTDTRNPVPEKLNEILDLWAEGLHEAEIGLRVGMRKTPVRDLILRARERGDKRAAPHKRGPKKGKQRTGVW